MLIIIIIADTNNIYACYSLFILFKTNTILTKIYPNFVFAIKIAIIVKDNLEYYGFINTGSHFYQFCYTIAIEKKNQNLDLLTTLIFYLVKNISTFLII